MQPPNQPMSMPPAGAPVPSGTAQDLLNVPSILIIVMAAIGVLSALYGVIGGGKLPPELLDNPQLTPEMKRMLVQFGGAGRWANLVGLIFNGVVIWGALQMRQLKSFGLAMTSAILVMLPCAGCCCLLGLPIGIWTLTILNKPEVKSAFS